MCLAAARRNNLELIGEDLRDAWRMLNEIEPEMTEVLDEFEMGFDARNRREIMAYLRKCEKTRVSKSELIRDLPRMELRDLNSALYGLLALGKLKIEQETPQRTVYSVHNY
jgi:hypothetical protein